MKLMIASDLHGSAYYAQKLLKAYHAEQPGKLLLLGDLLYHGPRNALPRDYDCMAAAGALNGIKDHILAVRGNCDSEVDQMVLQFPMMADYALVHWNGLTLYATHGHLWNEECPPPMAEGRWGHRPLQGADGGGAGGVDRAGAQCAPLQGGRG